MSLGPMEVGLILLIALVIFGPKKLPELGKGLGQGLREFKSSAREIQRDLELSPAESEPEKTT
ncbi:Sec-independent protein translocase subunit TatA/TatB [Deinococcus hopiensis]|uniref:Sec-independent protein translocase protein TatA n=1 Tax=Deinococcus hopiensis KR-140 TaxID=695939 RepID=A0A1W1UB98_9DEIO|nr:twin-arginine translocase TatA/TatE family subunit [Deinococcus hopiensis]SMB78378.1 sec-independent protein translocase protein TatA [Deinococcus hopiensis KR-140]